MHSLPLFALLALAVPASAAAQSVAVATTSGGPHSRSSVTVTAALGQTVRINRFRLKPVAVVEDSRCPSEVTCVWRGRIVVRLSVAGAQPITLENDKPVAFRGGTLTLTGASPVSRRGEKVDPASYRFRLTYAR